MNEPGLRPATRLLESEWLAPRLRSFRSHQVAAVVPDGFAAYVRILHPARDANDEAVWWAEVAAWSGRTMHPLVQFHALAKAGQSPEVATEAWYGGGPRSGSLPASELSLLCAILGRYTETPGMCWFGLWEGYVPQPGSSAVATFTRSQPDVEPADEGNALRSPDRPPMLRLPRLHLEVDAAKRNRRDFEIADDRNALSSAGRAPMRPAPRLHLDRRTYLLFEGPLSAASQVGQAISENDFSMQSPNLFWPEDRAWCVASEIDLFCTLVAGSEALVAALVADPRLEAWRVEPGDSITSDSDRINI